MNLNELKLSAVAYIDIQDTLTEDNKLQLLNFVESANEDQIKTLLLSGNIQGIDEAKDFIEKSQDDVKALNTILEIDPGTAVAAGMLGPAAGMGIGLALGASIALYRRYMTQMGKACAGRGGAELKACRRKFKANAKIKSLTQAKAKCGNDPKCKAKMDAKIATARQRASD